MPSFGDVPGQAPAQSQPQQQAPSPPGANPLLGAQQIPQAGPTPDQRISAYMDQVRNLHLEIDALASQHPEAADELGQAKQALTNSMAKVASAQAQAQSPQPPTM
jgi:hypothetical protein